MRAPGSGRRDGGFALLVVVFLLFAVGMSAAATYQLIRVELDLSSSGSDADRARAAAEAGARVVIGNAIRGSATDTTFTPNDTVFTIDDGSDFPPEVQVTIRKQVDDVDWDDLFLVTAIGRVTDPRNFDYPAIREVRVFARRRTPPIDIENEGAVLMGTDGVTNGVANSSDAAGTACAPTGVAARNQNMNLSDIGAPPFGSLMDADYPVDNDWSGGGWPVFAAGTYPVTRVTGDLTVSATRSGRGVLIVSGNVTIQNSWVWNGIVLAGGTIANWAGPTAANQVYGMMVAGLSGGAGSITLTSGTYRWHSCNVIYSGRSMGVMNPEPLTWWSGY